MVLIKRQYLKKEWCIRIIENPIRAEKQSDEEISLLGDDSRI
jgi:hypothetical protein